jgi:hypothetical protein
MTPLRRSASLYGGIFLLAGLSSLTSQMIVAHMPAPKPQATQTSGRAFVDVGLAGREEATDLTTVLIVAPLLVVVFVQMWRNRPR